MEVLVEIPFDLDMEQLLAKVHVDRGGKDARDVEDLAKTAAPLAKPKAIYEVAYVEHRNYDSVRIGAVIFTSRVLRVNLDKVERVFPFIVTCGKELDEIAVDSYEFVGSFWLDTIKSMALGAAQEYLHDHLQAKYAPGEISSMGPGEAAREVWPIEEQEQLFSIFPDVEDLIGVKLTDSCLMRPNMSIAGIYFPAEVTFESCRLCPREVCRGRKAPYDEGYRQSFYKEKT